ncbi:hypothetical protein GPZ15_15400, partial [Listeria monocytogenes]|nr:hypothetical protein [Listeria monocytogenes]
EALNRKGIPTIECKISKKLLLNEDIQSVDLEIKNKHTVIEKLSKNKMEVEANKELLKICKIENENLIKKVSALNFELVKMKEYKDHPIKTFWKDKIRFK